MRGNGQDRVLQDHTTTGCSHPPTASPRQTPVILHERPGTQSHRGRSSRAAGGVVESHRGPRRYKYDGDGETPDSRSQGPRGSSPITGAGGIRSSRLAPQQELAPNPSGSVTADAGFRRGPLREDSICSCSFGASVSARCEGTESVCGDVHEVDKTGASVFLQDSGSFSSASCRGGDAD